MTDQSFDYAKILYNIKPILSQDYKRLLKKEKRIQICCFNIQSNEEFNSSLYHLKNPKLNRRGQPKIPKFFQCTLHELQFFYLSLNQKLLYD